jgi:ABC-2 type transport system ATP-binding protein
VVTREDLAVEVRGLTKSYGSVQALAGIDLEIRRGEIFGLLGPNGAGKTTAVEILEGFRDRDGGTVSVLGHDPATDRPQIQLRTGIVLQTTGVEPYLSVRETLSMYATFYPRPRSVDEVIELVGLTEKCDDRANRLSGGQQRRLNMAMALIGDPELLFLDEPTTGFDPSARHEAWAVVKGLASLGATVVLTTHYMDEVQFLADRVAVIVRGGIVAEGPPSALGLHDRVRTRIRYRPPTGVEVPERFRGATGTDGFVVLEEDDPVRPLNELTGWALDAGVALDGLEVSRPTLEEVYLQLTDGREATA